MPCSNCVYGRFPRIEATPIKQCDLAIVAEAPGAAEISKGIPFVGPSGKLLVQALSTCGIKVDRDTMFITNALLCRPPKGKPIKREAVEKCKPRLLRELEAVKPKLVLALGNTAMHALTGNYTLKITTEQGRILENAMVPKGTMVVPAFHPAKILRTPGDYKTFRIAIGYAASLLRGGAVLDCGETEYQLIDKASQMWIVEDVLRSHSIVAADIETTGLDPRSDEILVIGIAYEKNKCLVLAKEAIDHCSSLFDIPDVRWCWHNGKFDISFLRQRGFLARVDHDTLLAHYALNETKGTHDLEQLSAILIGAKPYKAEANKHARSKKGLAGAPEDVVFRRVAMDADYTYQILFKLLPQVEGNAELKRLYYNLLLPASGFLQRVEENGLPVDRDALIALERDFSKQYDELIGELTAAVKKLWDPELYKKQTEAKSAPDVFSPTSTKQLAWLLYDRLRFPTPRKKGRSTDKEVLSDLIEQGKAPKFLGKILKLRTVQKDLSTYVRGIEKRLTPENRVHTSFLIHGTGTGRLSSRNPNIQNINKDRPAVRHMFQAPGGRRFVEADYKGAELRVLAHLSGDQFLSEVFQQGRDLHDEVAIHFFGQNFTHSDRMKAKTINFGIPYGRSEYSIAEAFGISVDEARALIQAWFNRAPEASKFLEECAETARRGGVLITPFGRHRRYGLITRDNVDEIMREARNFKIQSVASDLTLTSGMKLEELLLAVDAKIINLVHDSILVEAPDSDDAVREVAGMMQKVMREVPREILNSSIPFEVDIQEGKEWDRLKEIIV